ncbi:hypothetical protein Tco_1344321 [Tanacetum coccineum]
MDTAQRLRSHHSRRKRNYRHQYFMENHQLAEHSETSTVAYPLANQNHRSNNSRTQALWLKETTQQTTHSHEEKITIGLTNKFSHALMMNQYFTEEASTLIRNTTSSENALEETTSRRSYKIARAPQIPTKVEEDSESLVSYQRNNGKTCAPMAVSEREEEEDCKEQQSAYYGKEV